MGGIDIIMGVTLFIFKSFTVRDFFSWSQPCLTVSGVDFNQHPQTSRGNHESSAQQATTSVDMGERKDEDSKMQV